MRLQWPNGVVIVPNRSMFASPKQLKKSIMGIVTDSRTVEEPKDPEGNVAFELYRLMASPEETEALAERFRAGGYGYGEAKKALLEKTLEYFDEARARRAELAADPERVEELLRKGAEKARVSAHATMTRVREAAGLR